MNSNTLEAANRAEATALLLRANFRVYRPEADVEGEDLIVRSPGGDLLAVQQKGRVHVEKARYGNKSIWMLFPCSPWELGKSRDWFLIEHDTLFAYMHKKHGHAGSFAAGKWTTRSPAKHLRSFLEQYRIKHLA